MAYHTTAQIQASLTAEILIQLTDDARAGVVDETVAGQAAESAQSIIDGYLAKRYSLPLASTPGYVTEISIALATYWLYNRRSAGEISGKVIENRKEAMKLLNHIVDGKISLFSSDTVGTYQTNKVAGDRLFPKTALDQF